MGVNYTSAGAKKQTGSIFNVVTLSKSITANGGMQLCELYGLYGRICWKISFSPFDLMGEMKVEIWKRFSKLCRNYKVLREEIVESQLKSLGLQVW